MNTHINKKRIPPERRLMIDSQYFEKNQKWILWLANSWIGRKWIFKMPRNTPKKIEKIEPNSITFIDKITRKNIYYRKRILTNNKYAIILSKLMFWLPVVAWEKEGMEMIMRPAFQIASFAVLSFFFHPIFPLLGLTTTDYYTNSGAGGTTVAGGISNNAGDVTWATIHDATNGTNKMVCGVDFTSPYATVKVGTSATTNQFKDIKRAIWTFDTAGIPDGDIIDSASINMFGSYKYESLGTPIMHVCASTPANNNDLATEDYDQLGNTSFGSVAGGDWNASGYNVIALNASGLLNISKTGISRFGARLSWDINNSAPTWGSNKYSMFDFYCSDYNGTSRDIYLEVVYHTPVVAPTVTTQSATLVKMSGATGNGNITNNGGGTITEKGICYILGTSGTPTTADLTVHDHTDSTGAFTEIITGLLTGRAYRFRAYATNSAGTGYGDTVQVYTLTNFLQMFQ